MPSPDTDNNFHILQVIAHGLTPAWLRIGGIEADYITFVPLTSPPSNFIIDDEDGGDLEGEEEDSLELYSGFGRGIGYMDDDMF